MIELKEAAIAASEKHEADIFLYTGPIEDSGYGQLAQAVTASAKSGKPKAILILVTNGGSANAGYQIARMMQKMYDEFWLYCPSRCKSAGTLIALGAQRLIMDNFSELGPLDVQLLKEDEIGARKSGLLARSTFEALSEEAFNLYERLMINIKVKSKSLVSFKLASQLAADMSANLLSSVYAQVSPDIVGNEKRDLDIAVQYGKRLGEVSQNINSHTVEHLVKCYPSHDFIIDDDEARVWFNNVDFPSEELYGLVGALVNVFGPIAYEEADEPIVLPLSDSSFFDDENDKDTENERKQNTDHAANSTAEAPVDGSGDADRSSDSSERRASHESGSESIAAQNMQSPGGKVRALRKPTVIK